MKQFFNFCFLIIGTIIHAQTVGTIQYNTDTFEGYSIVHPVTFHTTYLINNCGRIINQWPNQFSNSTFAEITENGTLIRTSVDPNAVHFTAGGAAGIIQELNWNGDIIWQHTISNGNYRLHHDMEILPNGNLLVIAWELKNVLDCTAAGRIPGTLPNNELWPTVIYELQPTYPSGANIVWEWHAWDHLVQDHNQQNANYGNIQSNFRRIDINKGNTNNVADWAHVNGIHYNAELDHIILSSPTFNEIWIIDHSTSTAEAASSNGGNSGHGGDLLWRWGNPASYNSGTSQDQQLFFQHDPQWVQAGTRFNQHISVFDNRNSVNGQFTSMAKVLEIPYNEASNSYPMEQGLFLPLAPEYTYNLPTELFSPRVSGVQVLPNDNILIASGSNGHAIEINANDQILWQYKVPITQGGDIVEQGTDLNHAMDIFKMKRYTTDYVGFIGKDMTPQTTIETNPVECNQILGNEQYQVTNNTLQVVPNPATTTFTVHGVQPKSLITIVDVLGRIKYNYTASSTTQSIDTATWSKGIYFLKHQNKTTKIIVQ